MRHDHVNKVSKIKGQGPWAGTRTARKLAGISRSTIYRNTDLRTIIEHQQRTAPDGSIIAITDELATLRQTVQTLADTVRQHDAQLRRLTRD